MRILTLIIPMLLFHNVIMSQEIEFKKILKSQKKLINKNEVDKYVFNRMLTFIGFLEQPIQNKLNEFITIDERDQDTVYLLMAYDFVTAELYLRIWDNNKKNVLISRRIPKGSKTYDLLLEESEDESVFSDMKHIISDFENDFDLIIKAQTIIDGGLYFTGSYLIFNKSRTNIKSIAFTEY